MDFLYLIFYACMKLRLLDVETNSGLRHPVPDVCRILCSNGLGLAGNLSDLNVASSQYDILLCSETLVSDMSHLSELLVPDLVALSCCAGARCLGPEGWLTRTRWLRSIPPTECVVEKCWFLLCEV